MSYPDSPTSTDPTDQTNDPRDVNLLPPLGEGTLQDNWSKVNSFIDAHARKAMDFYTAPCDRADTNLQVLETGKGSEVAERDVISNKIRTDMLTMMSTLLRDTLTRTIAPEETGEPPEMVEVFDPMTMVTVPYPIDDQLQADFEQKLIDYHWNKADLDADVWMATFNCRTAGWYTAPYEWDWSTMLPRLRTNISVRQILLDPCAGPLKAVETANWALLRWRVNWWQARSLLPSIVRAMDVKAADGPEHPDPMLQLGENEQARTSGEKMVDLSFFWIRNYPVQQMSPEEALSWGKVEQRPVQGAPDGVQEEAGEQQAQPVQQDQAQGEEGLEAQGQGGPRDSAGDVWPVDAGQALPVAPPPMAFYLPSGDKPITPADPEWPWWLGTRQITRVERCIAEDSICRYYDIPLVHMTGNPLPLSACGQGDPETMQKMQEGSNRALTNAVEHSDLMAHPVQVYCASAWEKLPEKYKKEGASISGLQVTLSDATYTALGGKVSIMQDAPPISASIGEILNILGQKLEDNTPAPSVLQGKQTGDVTGWQSTQLLQQQAAGRFDLPAMFLQLFVKRLMNFVRHSCLWFVPIERIGQICSEYPPEVIESLVQRGRASDRDIEVQVNLSSGGVQARKISEAVNKFNLRDDDGERVIGMDTLRETMGEDNEKERRLQAPKLQSLQIMAQMAEQAKAQGAGDGPPQEQGGEPAPEPATNGHPVGANGNGRM